MNRLSEELGQALARGAVALTPGERAAHALRQAYGPGHAQVFSLAAWMRLRWNELILQGEVTRLLLNGSQERTLWRRAIRASRAAGGLQPEESLAELGAAAWSTLHLHNGRRRLAAHVTSTDARAFLRWAEAMETLLEEQDACTGAELPALLAAALNSGPAPGSPEEFVLVDFDLLLSAQQSLCEALRQGGHRVTQLSTAAPAERIELLAAPDAREELLQAAHWLRQELQASPDSRLALVVPQLGDRRAAIERTLLLALAPQQAGVGSLPAELPFEFSLGRPLVETSQGSTALLLLQFAAGPVSLAQASSLLLAPAFGGAGPEAEQLAAAEFDATQLRALKQLRPEITLAGLLRLLSGADWRDRLPSLLARARALEAASEAERMLDGRVGKPHARWADSFRRVLDAAGWTSACLAQPEGYAVSRRWEAALQEFSMLDFDGSRPSLAQALAAVRTIAASTVYAPESQGARVQVLGPLELGGVGFDALWFLSASDMSWPEVPVLNPLLPRSLARRLGMAGARADADAEHGRRVTERIAGAAARVVFSYPAAEGKQPLLPSPALAGLPLAQRMGSVGEPVATEPMESVPDQPTHHALPERVVRGGARLLELQSACAFRAFAEFRLFSSELAAPGYGLDAGERGSLVHSVMQQFWRGLTGQKDFLLLSPEQRLQRLEQCIEGALQQRHRPGATAWDHAYLDVQGERLRSLLEPWLQVEAARPAFTVLQSETRLPDVQVGPLHLALQADRVDSTAQGDVILDYKTGEVNPKDWRGDRPDKPQLPLYAVARGQVAGVAFASLRPGRGLKLEGFANDGQVFGGRLGKMDAPDMASQMQDWREILERLAHDFHSGVAAVDPKQFPATCKYCTHRILCRVDPSALAGVEADDDGNGYDG